MHLCVRTANLNECDICCGCLRIPFTINYLFKNKLIILYVNAFRCSNNTPRYEENKMRIISMFEHSCSFISQIIYQFITFSLIYQFPKYKSFLLNCLSDDKNAQKFYLHDEMLWSSFSKISHVNDVTWFLYAFPTPFVNKRDTQLRQEWGNQPRRQAVASCLIFTHIEAFYTLILCFIDMLSVIPLMCISHDEYHETWR